MSTISVVETPSGGWQVRAHNMTLIGYSRDSQADALRVARANVETWAQELAALDGKEQT